MKSLLRKKIIVIKHERNVYKEFPGDLVVRTWHFHCPVLGSVPDWGTEIPQAIPQCQKGKKNKREREMYRIELWISGGMSSKSQ